MPNQRICPLFGAHDPLKELSEYPECTNKCAWFDETHHDCRIVLGLLPLQGIESILYSNMEYSRAYYDEIVKHTQELNKIAASLNRLATAMEGLDHGKT